MGAAGGVERFEDLHDLPVRLLQGPSVDSARLWSKTSSEAPEGPLVSDRHDRPTTPAEKGDQLSAERELTCPPTGILGCPRSPPRAAAAILIAAPASSASGCSDVAAPSRCLEYRSITVARYSFGPRPSGPWDLGDITDPLGVGPLRGLVTLEQVGELQGGLVLPGQAVPAPD